MVNTNDEELRQKLFLEAATAPIAQGFNKEIFVAHKQSENAKRKLMWFLIFKTLIQHIFLSENKVHLQIEMPPEPHLALVREAFT